MDDDDQYGEDDYMNIDRCESSAMCDEQNSCQVMLGFSVQLLPRRTQETTQSLPFLLLEAELVDSILVDNLQK